MSLLESRPQSEQLRREIGGYELKPSQAASFIEQLGTFGFSELKPTNGNSGYATLYFLQNSPLYNPDRFRFRVYGLSDERLRSFDLKPDDVGVLELKGKKYLYSERIEHKKREAVIAAALSELVLHPAAAREILNSSKPQLNDGILPDGEIPRQVFLDFFENLRGGYLYPSLVILSKRRHFVFDPASPDRLRVTLDQNTGYLGYNPREDVQNIFRSTENLGSHPFCRVEVKLTDDTELEHAQKVVDHVKSIGTLPVVRKIGFQSYFRRFYGVPDNTAIQTQLKTNEIPGVEIEAKLNIEGDATPDKVTALLYKTFDGADESFDIHQGLETVRESRTHATRYGYTDKQGNVKEAFVITDRPENRWVGIKRKKDIFNHRSILTRDEVRETLQRWPEWTPFAEETVLEDEAKKLGVQPGDIFKVGASNRRKLALYVRNKETDRGYIISVDESISEKGSVKKQIEIEYGIRSGVQPVYGMMILPVIEADIEYLRDKVIKLCQDNSVTLVPTTESKFSWLYDEFSKSQNKLEKASSV